MADTEWIEIGRVVGDTGPKGDTGDIGIGTVIKGHYNNYDEILVIKVLKEILVRKAVKETKARLDQLDRKENLDLREILETQDLLEILDRPARLGTLELLALVLLLKVRMILTKN